MILRWCALWGLARASSSGGDVQPAASFMAVDSAWKGIFDHTRMVGNHAQEEQHRGVEENSIRAMAVSKDDRILYTAGGIDNKVYVWNIAHVTMKEYPQQPETTTSTTTAWKKKTLRKQLELLFNTNRGVKNKHKGFIPGDNGMAPVLDPDSTTPPPPGLAIPQMGTLLPGERVNTMVLSTKTKILYVGTENGTIFAYDMSEAHADGGVPFNPKTDNQLMLERKAARAAAAKKAAADVAAKKATDAANAKDAAAAPPAVDAAPAASFAESDIPFGNDTDSSVLKLKSGARVNQLVLSEDGKLLCGVGTYGGMTNPTGKVGTTLTKAGPGVQAKAADIGKELPGGEEAQGAEGMSGTGLLELRTETKGERAGSDPNGWMRCWDISKVTKNSTADKAPPRVVDVRRGNELYAIAISPDGDYIYTGGDDRMVRKFEIVGKKDENGLLNPDLVTANTNMTDMYQTAANVRCVEVDPKDPTMVYAGTQNGNVLGMDMFSNKTWDGKARKEPLYSWDHGAVTQTLLFMEDPIEEGESLITAGWRGMPEDPSPHQEETKEDTWRNDMTPPGDNPGQFQVWSVGKEKPELIRKIMRTGLAWTNKLMATHNQKWIISGGNDGQVIIWDISVIEWADGKRAPVALLKDGVWKDHKREDPPEDYTTLKLPPPAKPPTPPPEVDEAEDDGDALDAGPDGKTQKVAAPEKSNGEAKLEAEEKAVAAQNALADADDAARAAEEEEAEKEEAPAAEPAPPAAFVQRQRVRVKTAARLPVASFLQTVHLKHED